VEPTTLPIRGYRDEPVPNRFFRQEGETAHLAVVLPGLGYSCDMPLLYFTVSHLLDLGADVLQVDYAYGQRPEYRTVSQEERARWLLADATAAYRAGLDQRPYTRLALIGKSLGTRAMPALLAAEGTRREMRTIWFTPLLHEEEGRRCLLTSPHPALVVIGTADPYYDPATLDALRGMAGRDVLVVADAEHALEVPGDVARSVRALEAAMGAVQGFIRPEGTDSSPR
jgi:predicted alpha/beta-hydrolase family hydrolase